MTYNTRKINTETGEWAFGKGSRTTTTKESIRNRIHEQLKVMLGSVWYDVAAGFPWRDVVGWRGTKAENLLKNTLGEKMDEISGLQSWTLQSYSYEPTKRTFTFTFSIRAEEEEYVETVTL